MQIFYFPIVVYPLEGLTFLLLVSELTIALECDLEICFITVIELQPEYETANYIFLEVNKGTQ